MGPNSFTTAFCDSGAAFRSLVGQELAADCRILTASPFLQSTLGERAVFVRDRLNDGTVAEMLAIRPQLQIRARRAAQSRPETQGYSEIAAQAVLTSLDFLILAACLKQEDCEEPRLIVRVRTGNAFADQVLNGPWSELLADCAQARTVNVPVKIEGFNPATWGAPRNWLDRLRVTSWRRAAYRAVLAAGTLWPASGGREAIILSENELLQETAFSLAMRGWSLRHLRLATEPVEVSAAEASALAAVCQEALAPYCERWVIAPVRSGLVDLVAERLLSAASAQKASSVAFERALAKLPPRRNRVLLSNFPAKPTVVGAWHVARRQGLPLFGFQHSVSFEICDTQTATFATKDVVCSDRTYAYNERAATLANAMPQRQGASVPVGMPGDLRGMKAKLPFRRRLATIAFISTTVYSGFWGRVAYGTRNDAGMLAFELQMIRDVLSGLRHDVLYKRYPAFRLLDPDPAAAAAEEAANIRVYSEFVDMRYLLNGCDVLVTARATSTLSWCVMSDKPLIFVDIDDDMRLRDDARPAFEEALFLFSTAEPGWEAKLHAFLDRPVADIKEDWRLKAQARRELVRRYFDMGGPAGARAARDVAAFAREAKAGNPLAAVAS